MENINEKEMLEKLLKEFAGYDYQVDLLADAMMYVGDFSYVYEEKEIVEPEWKNEVIKALASARAVLKDLLELGIEDHNRRAGWK